MSPTAAPRSPAGSAAAARRTAHRLLGPRRYLRLVSGGFLHALRLGLLRGRPAFDGHYFLSRLVRAGDVVIDIGANLGYYTLPLAGLVGREGRVIAVEPVALYRRVLEDRTRRLPQVTALPFALGASDGEMVRLGVPADAAPYRHGLTRVADDGEFEAEMRRGSVLFADLARVDYVKCDVEGYEVEVLPEMIGVIGRHRPILQVETAGANRERLVDLFAGLGYRAFTVRGDRLIALAAAPDAAGDVIFLPPARLVELTALMAPATP